MKKIALIIVLFVSVSALQSYKFLICTYTSPSVSNARLVAFDAATGKGNIQAKCDKCGLLLPNNFNFNENVGTSISNPVFHNPCPKDTVPHKFLCGAKWPKPICK